MKKENEIYTGQEIPGAFPNYVKAKIDNITNTCQVNEALHNGQKVINANMENFSFKVKCKEMFLKKGHLTYECKYNPYYEAS